MKNKVALFSVPFLFIAAEVVLAAVLQRFFGLAVRTTLIVDAIMVLGLVLFYRRFLRPAVRPEFTMKRLVLFFCAQIPMWFCGQLAATYLITNFPETYAATEAVFSEANVIEYLALCMIVAPITEELLFRGVWYKCFEKLFGVVPAILISSAMFALMHGNLPQGYVAFLMGLLYGIVMRATGDIRMPIILHMLANLTDALAPVIPVPAFVLEPYFWLSCNIILLVALLGGMLVLRHRPVEPTPESVAVPDVRAVVAQDDALPEQKD